MYFLGSLALALSGVPAIHLIGHAHAGVTAPDSAQRAFEARRRHLLPIGSPGGGRCDERIGRFCYWYDERDTSLPAEPPRVREARARFLAELEAFHRQLPKDDWLLGQRVRYLVEHGELVQAMELT